MTQGPERKHHNIEGVAINTAKEHVAGRIRRDTAEVYITETFQAAGVIWRYIEYTQMEGERGFISDLTFLAEDGDRRAFDSLKRHDSLEIYRSTRDCMPMSDGDPQRPIGAVYSQGKVIYHSPAINPTE